MSKWVSYERLKEENKTGKITQKETNKSTMLGMEK